MKLLILIYGALTIINVQAAATKKQLKSNPPKENSEVSENDQTNSSLEVTLTPRNSNFPDTLCILFGDIGCNAACSVLGTLYIGEGEGKCDKSYICSCSLEQPKDIDSLWNIKFEETRLSTALLRRLKRDAKLSSEVLSILNQPLLSAKEMISLLKNSLKKLTGLLQPSEDQIINEYIDDDGIITLDDIENIEEFTRDELFAEIPKDVTNYLAKNNYKMRMTKYMATVKDEATISNILLQMDQLSNSSFVDYVYDYLIEHEKYPDENMQIDENGEKPSQTVINTIAATVIDELVTHADEVLARKKNYKKCPRNRFG